MANRRFEQFTGSLEKKLRLIYGEFILGTSGAVSSFTGNGVLSVTLLTTGIYQIQFNDNYYHYLGTSFSIETPTSGGSVNDGSLVVNSLYEIVTVGTTLWNSYGVPAGITPAVGVPFVATSVGGAGTGVAKKVIVTGSGLSSVEVAGDSNTTNNWVNAITGTSGGSVVLIQTFGATSSSVTTPVLASGVSGTKIRFETRFRDSMIST